MDGTTRAHDHNPDPATLRVHRPSTRGRRGVDPGTPVVADTITSRAAWPEDLASRLDSGAPVVIRLPGRGVPYPPRLRELADAGRLRRIGRPSRWGNPARLPARATDVERAAAVAAYRAHILAAPDLLAQLPMLRGQALGCRCWPAPCHGDVLVQLVTELA